MALTEMVIMPGEDYQAICDSVRAKTGGTELLKSGDISPAIDGIEKGGGLTSKEGTLTIDETCSSFTVDTGLATVDFIHVIAGTYPKTNNTFEWIYGSASQRITYYSGGITYDSGDAASYYINFDGGVVTVKQRASGCQILSDTYKWVAFGTE